MTGGGRAAGLLAVPVAVLALVVTGGSPARAHDGPETVVVADPRLTESSALAVSPDDPDLLYTINDSGHAPVVYVIDRTGGAHGQVVGTTTLAGVDRVDLDPEALAVGADGVLWFADTGDNLVDRDDVALYALPAPGRGEHTVTPVRYPVVYPPGLRDDAEALVADPASGALWIATKGWLYGSVFSVPLPLVADQPNRLRLLPGVRTPLLVTDGTVLPGGRAAVLRTYVRAYVYTLPDWRLLGGFPLPRQPQGEGLTALPGGRVLLADSEGTPTRIDRVTVPPDLVAAVEDRPDAEPPTRTPTGTPTATAAADGGDSRHGEQASSGVALGATSAAVVAGAAGLVLLARRRRR